jgi:hypothetical protein
MKSTKELAKLVVVLGLMVCLVEISEAVPMGTAFTYQGRLMDKNKPADGLYGFQFKLYDSNDPCTGTQLGNTIDINDLDVIHGHFIVELDFGSEIFDGNAVWLQTSVVESPLGSDPCTLTPRVELTPVPYALQTRGIFIDNTGNVGIGTTSPISKLEVISTESRHGIRSTVPYIAVYGHRTGTSGTWPGVHGECDSRGSSAAGVRGVITSTSPGTNSAGVRGVNNGTGDKGAGVYGWHAGDGYGVYGTATGGRYSTGVYGENTSGYGVYGYCTSGVGVVGEAAGGDGVIGSSFSGNGVHGYSFVGYAGFFAGDVYVTYNVSASSFTDRTPYPKDLTTAYQAVMSMKRLPEGQYDEMSKEDQLDHSMLSDFIRSQDGNRDLSATVSCHNEVLKDLTRKQQELGKAHIYIEQLHRRIEILEDENEKIKTSLASIESMLTNLSQ